jgi:hypothetical protein
MADLPGDLDRDERLEPSRGEAHERARKINPAYTEGDLVRVAGGQNQAEAELIQGILLEEGVPSVLRRTRGFDVPDFLAAGPRDVLVPASGAVAAHELLVSLDMAPKQQQDDESQLHLAVRLTVAILVVLAIVAAIAWLRLEAGG